MCVYICLCMYVYVCIEYSVDMHIQGKQISRDTFIKKPERSNGQLR